jgi:hypothetical protein
MEHTIASIARRKIRRKHKKCNRPVLVQGPLTEEGDKACFKEILTVLEESQQNAAIFSHALAQNTAWHPG